MSTLFSFDMCCDPCGTRGIVFWGEGGAREEWQQVTLIAGEFREGPPSIPLGGAGRELGDILCSRCG